MTGPDPKPAAEVEITEALVRSLLAVERQDLADGHLTLVDEGWDNAVWRLGDDLCVRVPRRADAVPLLLSEQRWLPVVAPRLTLAVPSLVHAGRATPQYPWPWSICRWVRGRTLDRDPLHDEGLAGEQLAEFLSHLHIPSPDDAPYNPYRSVPLIERDELVRSRAESIADLVDVATLLGIWEDATAAPGFGRPLVWTHGDLHPRNVVTLDGVLHGVIDFGDMAGSDPAVDLASAWTLLEPEGVERFCERYHAEDATWRRARGWAVNHGIACVATAADDPTMTAIGHRTLGRLLADPR